MQRQFALAACAAIAAGAVAQSPKVVISADLVPQLRYNEDGSSRLRLYDDTGNFSRARMSIRLENGWTLRVFQKLERIRNDPDDANLDQIFVERGGDWRVGKQYLPFGSGRILKESALALRIDTEVDLVSLPITFAAVETGRGRQRGIVARVGDDIGVSVAYGEHFGINGSAFTQLHPPEESAGFGRGHRFVFGVDAQRQMAGWTFAGEWVRLRDGHTVTDEDEDVVNARVSYQFPYGPAVEAETTIAVAANKTNFRLSADIPLSKKLFLAPSARFFDTRGWTYAIAARIRL